MMPQSPTTCASDSTVPADIIDALESHGIPLGKLEPDQRAMVLRAVALSISHVEHYHGDGLPALYEVVAQHDPSLAQRVIEETLEDVRVDREMRQSIHSQECLDREEDRRQSAEDREDQKHNRHLRGMTLYFTWGFAFAGTLGSFVGFLISKDPWWLVGAGGAIGGPVAVTALARNTRIIIGKSDEQTEE